MSLQFGTDDEIRPFKRITDVWDEELKPSQDSTTQDLKAAQAKVQVFIDAVIERSVAFIKDAIVTIKRYSEENSKSEGHSKSSPHTFFWDTKAEPINIDEKNRIIMAKKEIIKSSLISLIHFAEYAQEPGKTNDPKKYQDTLDSIVDRVDGVMPELHLKDAAKRPRI